MADDWIEEALLQFEFGDQDSKEIKAAIPTAQQLVALVQKNETDITHMVMLVKALLPVAQIILTKLKERLA